MKTPSHNIPIADLEFGHGGGAPSIELPETDFAQRLLR
jgi:hypothetical protein